MDEISNDEKTLTRTPVGQMLTGMIALTVENDRIAGATGDRENHRRVALLPCPIEASVEMSSGTSLVNSPTQSIAMFGRTRTL
jgi:hypothetical protein